MSSMNCLVGSYERKVSAARAVASDNAVVKKLMTKQTKRAHHYEAIALER